MWPAETPLISEDPDDTDRRAPRVITSASVDWSRIYQAVQSAILNIPTEVRTL